MTKTTSKSSFSRFSQFFRVFPGTEPSSLVFPHTPRTHYVCVRVWENYGSPLRKDQKHPQRH